MNSVGYLILALVLGTYVAMFVIGIRQQALSAKIDTLMERVTEHNALMHQLLREGEKP